MAVDSLGFGEARRGLPEQLAAAHEARGQGRPRRRCRRRGRSTTSSCSAWAAPASPATSSRPSAPRRCRCRSRCSSSTARRRSSARARSRSRCRTRATPRRRSRWRAARCDGGRARSSPSRAAGELAELAQRRRARCTCRCPDGSSCRALALGALVAPLFVMLFRMGCCPEAHAACCRAQAAARAPARRSARPTVDGAAQPGARAGAADRPHDPARLRRRRARRGRRACGGRSSQRERQGARVLERVPRARPQRDLRLGSARRRHPPDVHARRAAARLRARAARAAVDGHAAAHRGGVSRCSRSRPRARAASPSCST